MGLLVRASVKARPRSLLTKALSASRTSSDTDLAGILMERIQRLEDSATTPYTILSLLKTQTRFFAGLCVLKRHGVYHGYASIGLEEEDISIPSTFIGKSESTGLEQIGNACDLSFCEMDTPIWVFPLGGEMSSLLLLIEDADTPLNREELEPILRAAQGKLLPHGTEELSLDFSNILKKAFETLGDEQMLVTVFSNADRNIQQVSDHLAVSGLCYPLPENKIVVLIPARLDGELLIHRLSKSLGIAKISSFLASGYEKANEFLKSYL